MMCNFFFGGYFVQCGDEKSKKINLEKRKQTANFVPNTKTLRYEQNQLHPF